MTESKKLYINDIIKFLDFRWTIMDEPFVVVGDDYVESLKLHYEEKIKNESLDYKVVIGLSESDKDGMSVFKLEAL